MAAGHHRGCPAVEVVLILALAGSACGTCTAPACAAANDYAIPVTSIQNIAACSARTPSETKKVTIMVESDVATSPFLELAVEGAKTQCMVARGCCLRVHQLSANYTAEAPACAVARAADISDMVIGVGGMWTASIKQVAECNTGTKYGIIDVTAEDAGELDNVAGAAFKEGEAGFLAGIIAGRVSVSKKLHVVAGIENPPVKRYAEGFKAGVEGVCPTCTVGVTYTGDFGNTNNIGPTTAQAAMAGGADVIFGCGGFTGSQAIKYASSSAASAVGLSRTGPAAYVIGVDADEWVSTFESGAVDGADRVITSALKKVDTAAAFLVDSLLDTTRRSFVAGTTTLGVAENGVDYAPCHGACAAATAVITAEADEAKICLSAGKIGVSKEATSCELACTGIRCTFGATYATPVTLSSISAPCAPTTPAVTRKITILVEGSVADNPFLKLGVDGANEACTAESNCCLRVYQLVTGFTTWGATCAVRDAADMSDMVIGFGFEWTASIRDVSTCHNSIEFGIIDVTAEDAGGGDNVAGVTFKEDEAGFLAGIIGGYVSVSKKLHVVAGVENPPVVKYANGFKFGVESVCPTCAVGVTYTGDFANTNNIGPTTAQAAMAGGADVIFGCGGFTGSQAIKYASSSAASAVGLSRTGPAAYVIGVDADEWVSTFESGAVDGAGKVITSALKKVDTAAAFLVDSLLSDTFEKGTSTLGAQQDGVDYASCHDACEIVIHDFLRVAALAKACLSSEIQLGLNEDGTVPSGVVAPSTAQCDASTSLPPSPLAALTFAIITLPLQRSLHSR